MNAPHCLLAAALLAASTVAVHAQGGSLTPPAGPPVATMKSLDIVEPRIPLVSGSPGVTVNGTSGTITISQAGSYYLTKNLQVVGNADGIVINSSNVTVDLMGYAVLSPPTGNAQSGITATGGNFQNITIKNGHIRSTTTQISGVYTLQGFYYGVYANDQIANVQVENISIMGIIEYGILLEQLNGSVLNCSVLTTAVRGIFNPFGIVHNSTVRFIGGSGIASAVATGCAAINTNGAGIEADVVMNCYVAQNDVGFSGQGISSGGIVENSYALSPAGPGIVARIISGSQGETYSTSLFIRGITADIATDSYGLSNSSHGIVATSVSQCQGISYGTGGASSHGISADIVSFSRGINSSFGGGSGIAATRMVIGCQGESAGQHGIDCQNGTVTGSYGKTTRNISTVRGIRGTVVSQSFGEASGTSGGHGIEGVRSVTGSYGYSEGRAGIYSNIGTVSDSYGFATGNTSDAQGINGEIVANSRGQATGGVGIQANTLVQNSSGTSATSHGINVLRAAQNCYGFTTATVNTAHGIFSQDGNVSNCWGWSIGNGGGSGIKARIVISSNGIAVAGALHGIDARIVESSYGSRDSSVGGRFGILANRASLSEAVNGESITNKYNMP